jgi:ArsR family transcriptional regulator
VHEVVERIGLTQANISRHLNILYRAGVVERRREGTSVLYRVVDPNFVDICRTVSVTVASRGLGDELGVAVTN